MAGDENDKRRPIFTGDDLPPEAPIALCPRHLDVLETFRRLPQRVELLLEKRRRVGDSRFEGGRRHRVGSRTVMVMLRVQLRRGRQQSDQ